VRARVEAAAERFPHRRAVDLPWPEGVYPAFVREVAGVHAERFREHGDRYGEDVASKLASALRVTDDEVDAARAARERYRERMAEAMDGLDLILTPTLGTVAPRAGVGDLALRGAMIERTFPFNVTGAPALALPCGAADDGLPASVQLVGRPGADALVLAAGRLLEQAL
jgi:aspartyl-tRNA(Asn)/glutamyl-tRNA(Gln) amidotransferase subunit A